MKFPKSHRVRRLAKVDGLFVDFWASVKIVFVMRLIIMPTFLVNFSLGALTRVNIWSFLIGSCGLLVKISLHTFLGCALYEASRSK